VNPEDQRAQTRSDLGLTRERQVARMFSQPPSRAGSRGYETHWRQTQIAAFLNDAPFEASIASIYRWMDRAGPHRMTGNKEKAKLVGWDQMLLGIEAGDPDPDLKQTRPATLKPAPMDTSQRKQWHVCC